MHTSLHTLFFHIRRTFRMSTHSQADSAVLPLTLFDPHRTPSAVIEKTISAAEVTPVSVATCRK